MTNNPFRAGRIPREDLLTLKSRSFYFAGCNKILRFSGEKHIRPSSYHRILREKGEHEMKEKKPLLLFAVLFTVTLAVTGGVFAILIKSEAHAATAREGRVTYLIAGLDEAAENTDVLALATLDAEKKEIMILQIPRDTYFVKEGKGGKINRLFHSENMKTNRKDSAEAMRQAIEEVFAVPIDGYVFFSADAVETAVDALDGVPVTIPEEMTCYDDARQKHVILHAGEQTLTGREAVCFLRYRAGYTEGDLGRLDAQMQFLSCFYARLKERKSVPEYFSLYQKVAPKLLTNLTGNDIMKFVSVYLRSGGDFSLAAARLPGEACRSDGVWYYVVKRHAASRLLTACSLLRDATLFDGDGRLTDRKNLTFTNIYEDKNGTFPVYGQEEMEKMHPLRKDGGD